MHTVRAWHALALQFAHSRSYPETCVLSGMWRYHHLPQARARRWGSRAPAQSVRLDTAAEGRLLPGEVGCKMEQNEVISDTAQKESTGTWDPEAEITIRGGEGVIGILMNENFPFSVWEGLAT